ncbi:MAG: META domain-containing protein [Coriobacteriia bacterium]|nr:META domain-containing protein [Coriobacteriia bacterium]
MGGRAHPEYAALIAASSEQPAARERWVQQEDMPTVWRRVFVAALVLLAGIACVIVFVVNGGSALEGTSWMLTDWAAAVDPQPFTITASFADGQISGIAAVNSYSGECAVGGIKFSPGAIARTEMAGEPAAMEAESIYFDLLAQAETYVVEDDILTIRDAAGVALLVFAPVE